MITKQLKCSLLLDLPLSVISFNSLEYKACYLDMCNLSWIAKVCLIPISPLIPSCFRGNHSSRSWRPVKSFTHVIPDKHFDENIFERITKRWYYKMSNQISNYEYETSHDILKYYVYRYLEYTKPDNSTDVRNF